MVDELLSVTLSAACTSPAMVELLDVENEPSDVTDPDTVELLASAMSPEAYTSPFTVMWLAPLIPPGELNRA